MTCQSLIGSERSPDDELALIGPQIMCMLLGTPDWIVKIGPA